MKLIKKLLFYNKNIHSHATLLERICLAINDFDSLLVKPDYSNSPEVLARAVGESVQYINYEWYNESWANYKPAHVCFKRNVEILKER